MGLCRHPHDNDYSCQHPLGAHVCQTRGQQVLGVASFAPGYSGTRDLPEEELELYRRTGT